MAEALVVEGKAGQGDIPERLEQGFGGWAAGGALGIAGIETSERETGEDAIAQGRRT